MSDAALPLHEDFQPPGLATGDPADDVDLLVRETHHRMKNMLTLLGVWLRADFISTASADFPKAIDAFERRIVAFGRLYDLLSRRSERRYTPVGHYVGSLSLAMVAAILEPRGIRCEVMIGDGFLDSKRCERLGLIVFELVTNAAKHAFPNKQPGLICIKAMYRDGFWYCTVNDNGAGARRARRGVGERIVEDLARSIGGHVRNESCSVGTAITVVVPQ